MTVSLCDHAMLAALNISQWTARRYDKSVSVEVEKQHQAKDAGRYNKLLVDKAALEPMEKIAGAARQYHYKMTLPWGDNGERLLPTRLFMDFQKGMRGYKTEFDARVAAFVAAYPGLVQAARQRLGTMYEPKDYPPVSDIHGRFEFTTTFTPVPKADDFRVNLSAEHIETIRQDITTRVQDRQIEAVKSVWIRIREVVQTIYKQTENEDGRIYDSSIKNAHELIQILPALNLTNDPQLDQIAHEIDRMLVPPDRLREDKRLRADTAKKAQEILQNLPWA